MLKSKFGKDFMLGYTDQNTVKIDFDNVHYKRVKGFCEYLLNRFDLDGYIILRSSKNCYHVVFDKSVTWEDNMRIMGLTGLIFKGDVALWVLMQAIKQHSTLRISVKADKGTPRIVYKKGTQNHEIKTFRKYREMFRRLK